MAANRPRRGRNTVRARGTFRRVRFGWVGTAPRGVRVGGWGCVHSCAEPAEYLHGWRGRDGGSVAGLDALV
jgi:hypothetical protein